MTDRHTLNAVERACTDLARGGRPVTFTATAAAALSRSTLYRNPALRAVVEHHQRVTEEPLKAMTDDIATLRAAADTLPERVRHHEEQLRRLRN